MFTATVTYTAPIIGERVVTVTDEDQATFYAKIVGTVMGATMGSGVVTNVTVN